MATRNDIRLWRKRAKEAREIAEQTSEPVVTPIMLRVAQTYEEMAAKAEALLAARIGSQRQKPRR